MTSEKVLLEKFKVLPPNLKQKAIDFVDSLQNKVVQKQKKKSLKGALPHLNINVTGEGIRQAQNEMWRGYTKNT
jgi:hypothetical protein